MDNTLLSPEEVSRHLSVEPTTLRRYVTYFPSLFTGYARDEAKPRYTTHDVEVFSRITQIGDRISIAFPSEAKADEFVDEKERERQKALMSEDLASILINVSRDVDMMRETLESLVAKVDAASPGMSKEALSSLQDELDERLARIENEMGIDTQMSAEYRRTLSGVRWHWREDCPHYPRSVEHFKSSTRPFGFSLCTICLGKEDRT